MVKVISVVCAREGSKGLSNKCVAKINDKMVVFRTQYYSPDKAKISLQRLTGQKPKKDAENGVFYAETTPILTSNNKPQTLKDKETS